MLDKQRVHIAVGATAYTDPLPASRLIDTSLAEYAVQQLGRRCNLLDLPAEPDIPGVSPWLTPGMDQILLADCPGAQAAARRTP